MSINSTILIIDDDEISLLIMQNAFEMEGYNVIATTKTIHISGNDLVLIDD